MMRRDLPTDLSTEAVDQLAGNPDSKPGYRVKSNRCDFGSFGAAPVPLSAGVADAAGDAF